MIEKAAESLLQVPFLIFMPFLVASTQLPEGWNLKKIKDKDNKVSYQLYVPQQRKSHNFPVIIYLKENGGRLTQEEVIKIKKQADEKNQVFVIPKSSFKEWQEAESDSINKIMNHISKYRNIDFKKIELYSQNEANIISVKYICQNENSISNLVLLNYDKKVIDCPQYKNSININNDFKNILEVLEI